MSEALHARDLHTVLEFARTIGEARDLPAFRSTVLDFAPRLVPGDVHGYNEVPPRGADPLVLMDSMPDRPGWWAELGRLPDEHPLIVHYASTGDTAARAISDVIAPRAFHQSAIYHDVLAEVACGDQLAVSIPGRDGLVIGLAVNRAKAGFSVREHAVYDAIRPFLLTGYRAALERDHERMLTRALSAAADAVTQPVVVVARDGRVEHITAAAAELLGDDAPGHGARLNRRLGAWLCEQRTTGSPRALALAGCKARVILEVADGIDAIVLTRRDSGLPRAALRALGLTGREADVLALIAEGHSNASIATVLARSPATVAKHVQNINAKLEVSSRTAAVARARSLLGS